jgi:hypothetical protein
MEPGLSIRLWLRAASMRSVPGAHVGWFHISSRAVPRAHETRAHSYVVDEFILAMVPRVAARKDVVILEGTMGREMYLLSTGLMEVGQPWLMLL